MFGSVKFAVRRFAARAVAWELTALSELPGRDYGRIDLDRDHRSLSWLKVHQPDHSSRSFRHHFCHSVSIVQLLPNFHLAHTFAAIRYQSVMLVPSTFTWRLFGFDITNRVALYLLSAQVKSPHHLPLTSLLKPRVVQLMSSQPPASVLSSLAGITASAMYSFNLFSLRSFRLPPRLVSIASRLMSPLILPINPPTRGSRASLFGVDPSRPSATQARQARAAAAARTQTGTQAAPPQAGLQPTAQAQAGIVPPAGLLQQWRQGITGSPGLPSRPTNESVPRPS